MARRRIVRSQVALVAGSMVVAGTIYVATTGVIVSASPELPDLSGPLVVEIELEHDAYLLEDDKGDALENAGAFLPDGVELSDRNTVVVTDRFVWQFVSYSDWTFTQTCCADVLGHGDNSGWSERVTPDGEVFYRPAPDADWERVSSYDPADGMTPMPDLAPVRRGDAESLGTNNAVARALGFDPTSTAEYRHDFVRFVAHPDLEFPLLYEEQTASGDIVRRLVVTGLSGAEESNG